MTRTFLIFINDLSNYSCPFKFILLADDRTQTASFSKMDANIGNRMDSELVSANNWLNTTQK